VHLWSILQLLVLLMLANGTPVVAKKFLGERFTYPLDGGVVFVDGRPLFGRSKTIRGVVLAVLVTTAGAPMIGLEWGIGVLVGTFAMAGDPRIELSQAPSGSTTEQPGKRPRSTPRGAVSAACLPQSAVLDDS